MKRFLKILVLLIIGLFLLVSGVDAALDRLSHSVAQNSYTLYNDRGDVMVAYSGDLRYCPLYAKPGPVLTPTFIHRTSGDASSNLAPASSSTSPLL